MLMIVIKMQQLFLRRFYCLTLYIQMYTESTPSRGLWTDLHEIFRVGSLYGWNKSVRF